nr:CHAT domain-containing protein [Planctomycetota bacterium]
VDAIVAAVRPPSADVPLADAAIQKAKDVLVKPLELGADVTRVLVSPAGPIAFTPVALLFGDRDVGLVPSGTTLGLLRGQQTKRGTGVLALADPDYTGRVLGADTLPRLPATREEAKAIGDKLLLGKEATEAALRAALAKNPTGRWRAVHLACHGTVDEEQPLRSSLVVTADEQDDGYLTAIELYQMRIASDCVSLSACETGLGKMARGEGVLGLVRGFMLAGAPRVLSSLWRVEDEAARALMVKFYELWHPKEGEGIGAAAALRQAQAYVAAQPKWKHPWYWSGWVLWGLPD